MKPKFEEVKARIEHEISLLGANAKLPSERDLIALTGYSRPTVQKALQELEQDNLVYKLPRKGWYVADRRLRKSLNKLQSFKEDIEAGGDVPSTKLVAFEKVPADDAVAAALQIKPGEDVYRVTRVRYKNGDPIIYDINHFRTFVLEGVTVDVLIDSIYSYLENVKGYHPSRSVEIIDAELPSEEVARQLELPPDSPVIKIVMTAFLRDERPFEFSYSYKNPKKYRLEIQSYRS